MKHSITLRPFTAKKINKRRKKIKRIQNNNENKIKANKIEI